MAATGTLDSSPDKVRVPSRRIWGTQPKSAPNGGTSDVSAATGTMRAAIEPQIPPSANETRETSVKHRAITGNMARQRVTGRTSDAAPRYAGAAANRASA